MQINQDGHFHVVTLQLYTFSYYFVVHFSFRYTYILMSSACAKVTHTHSRTQSRWLFIHAVHQPNHPARPSVPPFTDVVAALLRQRRRDSRIVQNIIKSNQHQQVLRVGNTINTK